MGWGWAQPVLRKERPGCWPYNWLGSVVNHMLCRLVAPWFMVLGCYPILRGCSVVGWLCVYRLARASLTVSLLRPLARLLDSTLLPTAEAMRAMNPCLFRFFLWEGW